MVIVADRCRRNWNTALRYLNLSGNKRLEIKPTSAQDMSHASSFRKELSDFTALTQLRVLGLMDVTLRIPSLPDESDEKRVRTSFSDINNMAYGISDMLGSIEHLAMFDLVVPNFRGKDNECLFGMFGRPAPSVPSGKVPKFLQESFSNMLSSQLERLSPEEDVTQALRRTFLYSNRKTFEFLTNSAKERKRSVASFQSMDSMFRNWHPGAGSQFRTGAAGAVVYLVDHTLHVANVGDTLVVISRKGEAELLSKLHDPTDREETARIRRAEAWVSPKGYINDDKDVDISRGFGYWQHFPAINASPEVRTRQIAESDEFVIIGNHALWKCCSYQTAVDIARTERDDPMMAAQKLRDFAISYGADGSVMVMVVNISDLFFGRGGQRPRAQGSGPTAPAEQVDGADAYFAGAKRAVRRRYEEVGDRTLNRLQQEIEPPQGQVAIVFTDIVNSTHLWETNPGMPTSIKIHHSLFRRQLRLDGGYEVKTEGDSFMVSFQTVLSAMLWCFNCQILLLQQEWPRELLDAHDGKVIYDSEGNLVQRGLRVRMGIHWGSPQCERDPITRRMDYYGPMVNRAARINASADGGQLMASQDVINEIQAIREYLDTLDEDSVDELPQELKRELQELKRIGLVVKDMGQRKLKGLEGESACSLLSCLASSWLLGERNHR
jgi:adenylate cyclase